MTNDDDDEDVVMRHGSLFCTCGHVNGLGRFRLYRLIGGVVAFDDVSMKCEWIIACLDCVMEAEDDVRKISLAGRPAPFPGPDWKPSTNLPS